MRKIKRLFKLLRLILLVILAGIGIGIAGGVPFQPKQKKEDFENHIEQIDPEDEAHEMDYHQMKNIKNKIIK